MWDNHQCDMQEKDGTWHDQTLDYSNDTAIDRNRTVVKYESLTAAIIQ